MNENICVNAIVARQVIEALTFSPGFGVNFPPFKDSIDAIEILEYIFYRIEIEKILYEAYYMLY